VLDNRIKGTGGEANQAPPAAAHIDEGTVTKIEDTECATSAGFGAQTAATAAAGCLVDHQFEGHVPNSRHRHILSAE
jgi:hypothetical protein